MEFSDSWYNFSICWSPAGLGLSKNCFIWSPADCPSWELMFLEQFSNTAPNGKSAALLQPQLSSGMCGGEPTSDTWSRQGRKLKFSIVFLSPQCLTFWGLFHLDWILSFFIWPKRIHLHCVWKSQKKSFSTMRAKRATFTFRVDKSSLKMPKNVQLASFWKLKVCSQTVLPDWQNGKNCWKMPKILMRH